MNTSLLTSLKGNMGFKAGEGFIPTAYNWAKPSSWPELRQTTPEGSVSLLLCDKYPSLNFSAACAGGYKVLIDDEVYSSYDSGSLCNINIADISSPGILADYPEALTLHTVKICPQNANTEISSFKCMAANASVKEEHGILWAHFNIGGTINLYLAFSRSNMEYTNPLLEAVTARDNLLKVSSIQETFYSCSKLKYLPVFDFSYTNSSISATFYSCSLLKEVNIKNAMLSNVYNSFTNASEIEMINFSDPQWDKLQTASEFMVNLPKLDMPMLDLSEADILESVKCYGTAQTPMNGFKGLTVSSEAKFTGSSPQIKVDYTGLDRAALKTLFESLPQVSAAQKISIIGALGANDLSEEDLAQATDKGWEVLL